MARSWTLHVAVALAVSLVPLWVWALSGMSKDVAVAWTWTSFTVWVTVVARGLKEMGS